MNEDKNDKEGIDLSGAMRDDSGTDVKFEEYRVERPYYRGTPKVIQWVIKYSGGLVKDKKQAQYVLLGFVVLVIIVSLFLIFGGSGEQNTPPVERHIDKQQFLPK